MATTLDTLFVDVTARGLNETAASLRKLQGDIAQTGTAATRMRDQLRDGAGKVGMPSGGGGGAGGLGQLAGAAAGLATIGGALKAISAADPAVMEQFGRVMHDIAGTVGQVLLPAVRPLVPVFRQVADVLAGLADAVKPTVQALAGALVPILQQVVGAVGGAYQSVASTLLPVFQQVAQVVAPLAGVFLTLLQAAMPLGMAIVRMQTTFLSIGLGLLQGVLPALTVMAEVLGSVAAVVGEVSLLFADLFAEVVRVMGEVLAPVREFVTLVAGALVQGLRLAVAAFKSVIDTVRAFLGIQRRPVGAADSVGRGFVNQTGTEDANSTFNRIQEAVLKAGMAEEQEYEEKSLGKLDDIRKAIDGLAVAIGTASKPVQEVRNFAEGAAAGGQLAGNVILKGLFGRQ